MEHYLQRVKETLLPLSVSKEIKEAIEEWQFTGETVDYEEAIEICLLCYKENLRYHYRIANNLTNNQLWVGSKCITKFGIPVYDENGKRLSIKEAESLFNTLQNKMRLDSCIKTLEDLAKKENNDILTNALTYYKKNGVLTPKQARVVFWRLKTNNIDHHPSFFKVCLNKHKYQQDLKEIPTPHVHNFWEALSPSQKKMAQDLGHKSPKDFVSESYKFPQKEIKPATPKPPLFDIFDLTSDISLLLE